MRKLLIPAAASATLWVGVGVLLIYAGNSPAFASVIGGTAALPVWFARLLSAAGNRRETAAKWLNAAWAAIMIYAVAGLLDITSSEVAITSTILIVSFSKWKELADGAR